MHFELTSCFSYSLFQSQLTLQNQEKNGENLKSFELKKNKNWSFFLIVSLPLNSLIILMEVDINQLKKWKWKKKIVLTCEDKEVDIKTFKSEY